MDISRKSFLASAAAMAAAPSVMGDAVRTFKVGVIGCGGRGTGATKDITTAAATLGCKVEFTGFADFFQPKAEALAAMYNVDKKFAFSGANGYKQVLDTDCEIVILATPPFFRPRHTAAAVAAGKHIFAEKPIATDPQGVRDFLAATKAAKEKNLSILAGTCMRYKKGVLAQYKPIVEQGAIGKILSGRVYRCHGPLNSYARLRENNMSNAAYLCNAWYMFWEMGGDQITEQAIHEQDLANWFIGRAPKSAIANGARWRRPIGDIYDEISIDFDYGDELHVMTMGRHMENCASPQGTRLVGTEGWASLGGKMIRWDGKPIAPDQAAADAVHDRGVVAEHVDLLKGLLSGNHVQQGEQVAMATATCVMGTLAAYSGRQIKMADILSETPPEFYKKLNAEFRPIDFETTNDIPMPPDGRAKFVPGMV